MRLIFLLPQVVFGSNGGFVGGYANSVINLLEVMQQSSEPYLITGVTQRSASGESELQRRLHQTRTLLLPMRSRAGSSRYAAEFIVRTAAACRRLRQHRAAFLYGHSGHPAYTLATWLAARCAKSIPIHALYCPMSQEFQHRKVGLVVRSAADFGLGRMRQVVVISNNVKKSLSVCAHRQTAPVVIPPAIPDGLGQTKETCHARGGSSSRTLTVGFVGHHMPEKGFDLALYALQRAVRSERDVQLLALLSGREMEDRVQREVQSMLATHGLSKNATVIRNIKDMREYYSQLDLLLIPFRGTRGPSDYPMVLLEALSVGVPVVCTPVGAIPELVISGKNGFLSSDCSPQAYAAALSEAIAAFDQGLIDLTANAVASVRAFRASAISKQTLELLRSIHS